ncbi:DUF6295 family protein [Actinophytocola sp.]|uniref:DUF6295 family protein n=1 Tax=Actinophytocola sp. TaxID=1872138 RepID=UPI0025B819D0|nr:DUF6295 family protein [Actinophytocola sp.]
MCTYVTEQSPTDGSGKGATGWFPLTSTTVYFDHPVHAQADHTLNLDFVNPGRGPAARVAVELTAESAVGLVQAIARVLTQVSTDLTGVDGPAAQRLLDAAEGLTPVR